ncbi:hypothetical protein GH714_022525 [Hevea brasiliensis]|uniref:Uncharacterized protein n=1 Tax=Hevea brasiliensis TaxID=3981 RepID=A0A6A6M4M9_HEVBR|nr:hypothetical protein GH714_022525 [Hevea brasiliensis]
MDEALAILTLTKEEEDELVLEAGDARAQKASYEFCLLGQRSLHEGKFFHLVDLKRVVDGSPWSFRNHLLITHRLQEGEIPSQVPLFKADFRVQVHYLPVVLSEQLAKQLGNFVGDFIEYDTNSEAGGRRSYTREKVEENSETEGSKDRSE